MKRITTYLGIVAIVALALAGCGETDSTLSATQQELKQTQGEKERLFAENTRLKAAEELRLAEASARQIGVQEARANKLKHVSGCNSTLPIQSHESFRRYGDRMSVAYKSACIAEVRTIVADERAAAKRLKQAQAQRRVHAVVKQKDKVAKR